MTASTPNPRSPRRGSARRSAGLAFVLGVLAVLGVGCSSTPATSFASPEEATQALISALRPVDEPRLKQILGPDSDNLVSSGDDVLDRENFGKFVAKYDEKHALVADGDDAMMLEVGPDGWPLPIPIIKKDGRWSFDAEAGKEEIVNRRIGNNELCTMQVCLAIVDAQREYALLDPTGDGVHEYAQKFFSDAGKRNGLYWESAPGEPESPLGSLAASAAAEGYTRGDPAAGPRPYHGYYYRILTSQGDAAPGGTADYLANGQLIGGFGVIAWPASYRSSGVMTFMTNQDGVVYERDLGSSTDSRARSITRFDPAADWRKVEVVDVVEIEQ